MIKVAGANWQAGTEDCPLPRWVIVDAGSKPSAEGYGYRLMDPRDCVWLPDGALCQPFNERDYIPALLSRREAVSLVRQKRPDLQIVYGGDTVDPATGWSYSPPSAAVSECDYYGLHATATSPYAPAMLYGKPVIVTELEKDPANLAEWLLIARWMARSEAPCFFFTWEWRDGDSRLNLKDRAEVVAAIAALNSGGVEVDLDVEKALDDINHRISLQTEGLRRVTEGKYNGAAGSAGIVVELEGGQTTVDAQPDYSPKA